MAVHRITCGEGFAPTTKIDHYFCQHLIEAQQLVGIPNISFM